MKIEPKDLSISSYNTGSAWFPNQSGIRVTHIPTGIYAECGDERSQHANKAVAYDLLCEKLKKAKAKPHIRRIHSFITGDPMWGLFPTKKAKKPVILASKLSTLWAAWRARVASQEAKKAESARRSTRRSAV